jgi:hypothetical protein
MLVSYAHDSQKLIYFYFPIIDLAQHQKCWTFDVFQVTYLDIYGIAIIIEYRLTLR